MAERKVWTATGRRKRSIARVRLTAGKGNITVNGKHIAAPEGSTILEAARAAGIAIPSLCHIDQVNTVSACRICVVEVKGMPTLKPSCSTTIQEGMEIITDSERQIEYDLVWNRNEKLPELGRELLNYVRDCMEEERRGLQTYRMPKKEYLPPEGTAFL